MESNLIDFSVPPHYIRQEKERKICMKKTTNLPEALTAIQEQKNVLIYISTQNCTVCHAVLPKVEKMLEAYDMPAYHFDATETPEVASRFEVLTAPAVLVFNQGKEVLRQARFIDFEKLKTMLDQLTEEESVITYEDLFK
jgi:thioredoxin-like negative regulator of GroEL